MAKGIALLSCAEKIGDRLPDVWATAFAEVNTTKLHLNNSCIVLENMTSSGYGVPVTFAANIYTKAGVGSDVTIRIKKAGSKNEDGTTRFTSEATGIMKIGSIPESHAISPVIPKDPTVAVTHDDFEFEKSVHYEDLLKNMHLYFFTKADAYEYLRKNTAAEQKAYAKEHAFNYYFIQPQDIEDTKTDWTYSCSSFYKPALQLEWNCEFVEQFNLQDHAEIHVVTWTITNDFGNWYPPLLQNGGSYNPPADAKEIVLPYRGHLSIPYADIHRKDGIQTGITGVAWMEVQSEGRAQSNYVFFTFAPNKNPLSDTYFDIDFSPYGKLNEGNDDGSTIVWASAKDPEDLDDNDDDIEPNEPENPTILDMGLTTTYSMTVGKLKRFGDWIWSASFWDNIKLLNNSPIENIISVKAMPVTVGSTGANLPIILGNVNSPESARVVTSDRAKVTIGSFTVPYQFKGFLDYRTAVQIHLPFIGIVDLDIETVLGRTFTVDYIFDLITGTCKALILCEGSEVYAFDGIAGVDIPITASNRANYEANQINAVVQGVLGAGASAASGNVGGAIASVSGAVSSSINNKFTSITSGSPSPSTAMYTSRNVYLIIRRVRYARPSNFDHTYGRPLHATYPLSKLHGFTKVSSDCNLSGIKCSPALKDKLRQMLIEGIYA